jgi:hypothetical protein
MHATEAYGGGGTAPLINLDTVFRRPGRFTPRVDTAGTH